eukprot:TRINITY_DN4283_c0_g4_i3.p1 TRINITY_DN4283_c0_g4~~TRINITY_DN4283_c0_g4_i3.p1  ORF type:complete len:156 (-),score=21.06 TRINITY_DN4283_c0_g4_i3:147-614(-)
MANIPKFKNKDFLHKPVDFDLKKVYSIPFIENMIFMFTNYDKCRREVINYEKKRQTLMPNVKHPIHYKPEALALLRCHASNMQFEPVCLDAFNDARECLFQTEAQVRLCENELHLFEECIHNPVAFTEFLNLSTPHLAEPKVFSWLPSGYQNNYS